MDSAKLNDWMQVIGIFALVGSLIFVGLQMKQSQEIAIAEQYQARATTAVEIQEARQQSELISRLEGQLYIDQYGLPDGFDEKTTAEEFGILIFDARRLLYSYDNNHFQYVSGFLSEESWQANRRTIGVLAQMPIYLYLINHSADAFRTSYADVWRELADDDEPEQ